MATLKSSITENGVSQGDLVRFLENVVTLVNELKTDYTALRADVTAIRTAVTGITAQLDADDGVTDTDYAASNDPDALTSTAVTASDLTLSEG